MTASIGKDKLQAVQQEALIQIILRNQLQPSFIVLQIYKLGELFSMKYSMKMKRKKVPKKGKEKKEKQKD